MKLKKAEDVVASSA